MITLMLELKLLQILKAKSWTGPGPMSRLFQNYLVKRLLLVHFGTPNQAHVL